MIGSANTLPRTPASTYPRTPTRSTSSTRNSSRGGECQRSRATPTGPPATVRDDCDGLGRPLGGLVEMSHLGRPLGFAMVLAVLLQPASGVGLSALVSAIVVRCATRLGNARTSITLEVSPTTLLAPVLPGRTRQLHQGKRADQSVPLQVRALACTHFMNIRLSQIIVATRMKNSVDNVERQLGRGLGVTSFAVAAAISVETTSSPTSSGSPAAERVKLMTSVGQSCEVFPVDPANGRVVHEGHRDRRVLDALIAEDTLDQPGEAVRIDIEKPLVLEISTTMAACWVRSESSGS